MAGLAAAAGTPGVDGLQFRRQLGRGDVLLAVNAAPIAGATIAQVPSTGAAHASVPSPRPLPLARFQIPAFGNPPQNKTPNPASSSRRKLQPRAGGGHLRAGSDQLQCNVCQRLHFDLESSVLFPAKTARAADAIHRACLVAGS